MDRGPFAVEKPPYRIVPVLPTGREAQQYRVRSDAEPFERVLDEGRLEAVSHE